MKTEKDAIKVAVEAIHKFQLTTVRDECGVLNVIEKPSYFDVIVRERHVPSCGGTPDTSPRLFTLRIRKRDGRLTTDAYDGVHFIPADTKPGTVGQ